MNRLALSVITLFAVAAPSFAGLHYFSQDDTIYRFNSATNALSSWNVGVTGLTGLAFDSSGQLWATSNASDAFYTVDFTGGTPSLNYEFASGGNVITFDFIGGDLVGLRGNDHRVVTYDLQNSGNVINSPSYGLSTSFPSSAFDGTTYYGANNNRGLYTVDVATGGVNQIATITDAATGQNLAWNLAGGSWFQNQYWQAVTDGSQVRIGTIDLTSGVFTEAFDLGSNFGASAMGYATAVVPAPAAGLLAAFGLGFAGWFKGRRN
jgi:hypothetical protein